MTFTKSATGPKSVLFKTKPATIILSIKGQGVLLFETKAKAVLTINNSDKTDGLTITFSERQITVQRISNKDKFIDPHNLKGIINKSGATYWFSLDAQNQCLYAGIGEARIETANYVYQFPHDKSSSANKVFMESLATIDLSAGITPLRLLRDPITAKTPLLIKDTNSLTMSDVAEGKVLPSGNLSPMSQRLYNCVSGDKFTLNSPDFPDFIQAIEHSIATPGLWCNKTLKSKDGTFGKSEPAETYLRITLGQNNGESPGIPYVLEIWPVGHYSPIHNHGGASAIIRVLNGSINVKLFPFLCDDKGGIEPHSETNFQVGDITWISPTLNQVHQLKNEGKKDTCMTIQCYMYENEDAAHYDYFDYVDTDGSKKQFEPDSDADFLIFKEIIRQEWTSQTPTCNPVCFPFWLQTT